MRLQDAIWVNLIATRCRLLPSVLRISEKDPSIAGCSEVEPSSHGLVNACAAFPSEAHAAHRYAWVNNSATCCEATSRKSRTTTELVPRASNIYPVASLHRAAEKERVLGNSACYTQRRTLLL